MSVLQSAWELISDIRVRDVIDIVLVATLVYYLARLLRRTRAISRYMSSRLRSERAGPIIR